MPTLAPLCGRRYLRMLDGALREPFFPRGPGGGLLHVHEDPWDPEGMGALVDLDAQAEDAFDEVPDLFA